MINVKKKENKRSSDILLGNRLERAVLTIKSKKKAKYVDSRGQTYSLRKIH